jgi:predicted nucleic acid-binding protein
VPRPKKRRYLLRNKDFSEVFKKLLKERGISLAEHFYAQVRQLPDTTIMLDTELIRAAQLSWETRLPMADAIIYATAQAHAAELVTSDAHFSELPGVTLI